MSGSFEPPLEVDLVDIDPASGARALAGCPRREATWFVRGTEPEDTCPGFRIAWPDFLGGGDDDEGVAPREDSRPPRGARRGWLRRFFGRLGGDE